MVRTLKKKQRSKKIVFVISGLIYLVFLGTGIAQSFAEDLSLSLSSGGGETNGTVSLTLSLGYPGADLASGFNLDIYYDNDALENPSAVPGVILSAAGKTMQTNEISHPYHGILRLVVFDSNYPPTILQAGVAATIDFDIRIDAPGGETALELEELDATDAQGESLDVIGNNGLVDVVVGDFDEDEVLDNLDNCPFYPNGPLQGTCTKHIVNPPSWIVSTGQYCTVDGDCDPGENCEKVQADNYPPGGNGIGDACDCESDFGDDGSVVADDVADFLDHFGRSALTGRPCTNGDPCDGDFLCDRAVHAGDVSKFLEDFGRNTFPGGKPCPPRPGGPWCSYD